MAIKTYKVARRPDNCPNVLHVETAMGVLNINHVAEVMMDDELGHLENAKAAGIVLEEIGTLPEEPVVEPAPEPVEEIAEPIPEDKATVEPEKEKKVEETTEEQTPAIIKAASAMQDVNELPDPVVAAAENAAKSAKAATIEIQKIKQEPVKESSPATKVEPLAVTAINSEQANKAPVAKVEKRHPLDHDGDGKPGGSLPKSQRKKNKGKRKG